MSAYCGSYSTRRPSGLVPQAFRDFVLRTRIPVCEGELSCGKLPFCFGRVPGSEFVTSSHLSHFADAQGPVSSPASGRGHAEALVHRGIVGGGLFFPQNQEEVLTGARQCISIAGKRSAQGWPSRYAGLLVPRNMRGFPLRVVRFFCRAATFAVTLNGKVPA